MPWGSMSGLLIFDGAEESTECRSLASHLTLSRFWILDFPQSFLILNDTHIPWLAVVKSFPSIWSRRSAHGLLSLSLQFPPNWLRTAASLSCQQTVSAAIKGV